MSKIPQVALLVETSRGYGRQISLGVARYTSLHGPWSVYILPRGAEVLEYPKPDYWEGDGIITRLENPTIERGVLEANLPTISLDMTDEQLAPDNPLSRFTDLQPDSKEASNLAADHLISRGYRSFAFVGTGPEVWSMRRQVAFEARVASIGCPCEVYCPAQKRGELSWEEERPLLATWLEKLPKPVGVMAANDIRGRQVLDACRLVDILVPKDLGVIGVDNDELFCELSYPTLTSVSLNAVAGGYAAAERLDKMMKGRKFKNKKIVVKALRVVDRQSTNVIQLEDRSVVDALEFIHHSKGRGIAVTDVADRVKLARRDLDARFSENVGHTVAVEIQRARLENAKRLLEETDYPIPEVATAAGYSSDSYMVQVFRKQLNQTPAKYRASVRVVTAKQPSNGNSELSR